MDRLGRQGAGVLTRSPHVLSPTAGCQCHAVLPLRLRRPAKAVAVDVVAGDEDWFIAEAERSRRAIVHVIDTHVHADHFSGGPNSRGASARRTTCTRATRDASPSTSRRCPTGSDSRPATCSSTWSTHPGTRPTASAWSCATCAVRDEPWFVITGDTLFVGAVGRPDLAGQERVMAAQLYDTLKTKLLTLPAELEIYPGHQAGSACGAGLSGKPASTIGFEKRFNPMLSRSRDAFVETLTTDIPPQPPDMARIVEANLRGVAPDAGHA